MNKNNPLIHQPWFWDVQIAALLLAPPLLAGWILSMSLGIGGLIIATLLLLGSLTVAYGSFIEPLVLKLNKKIVHISRLPAITIAVAADFHTGPYRDASDLQRIVKKINALKPDLIVLPGDFLYDHHAHTDDLLPLGNLKAPLGVYAVMGNHDTGDHVTLGGKRYKVNDRSGNVTTCLRNMGITVLRDEWTKVESDGHTFAIAGVDGPWADEMNMEKTVKDIPADLPIILLAHNPDVVLTQESRRASLIFSGHTHGGQIRLPLIGALHVPAETGKAYDQGIFNISEHTTLAVTHGCGETLARARLLCAPEILVVKNSLNRANVATL